MTVRSILSAIGVAFTAYMAARGLWWIGDDPVQEPWLVLSALPLYLVVTWLWIFWGQTRRSGVMPGGTDGSPASVLPLWMCMLAVATALIVPNAVMFGVSPDSRTQPYATWVIGGIGALMTIVMARRRTITAWIGLGALAVSISLWIGPFAALSLGLVGSVVWVAAAQLLVIALNRAADDTGRLAELQRAASAWQAAQSGRQRERRLHVQRALQVAGPILGRTIETGGNLRPEERVEARLAEGRLRDELRGPRLLDDAVRAELEAARRRGVTVTILDEGGLEDLAEEELEIVRAELATAVRSASSNRVIIRTSPDQDVAVTVVGRSSIGESLSDEDSVDLWQEIRRPGR